MFAKINTIQISNYDNTRIYIKSLVCVENIKICKKFA